MNCGDKSGLEKIKLLIVDDEEGYVDILCKRLRKRNFDVTTALTGVQGIQALRRTDFDIALIDVKMEDMDGIEVLKVFKKMDPTVAVILLTGHASDQAAREGLKHGAFDYLMKPVELEELMEKIREACNRRSRK